MWPYCKGLISIIFGIVATTMSFTDKVKSGEASSLHHVIYHYGNGTGGVANWTRSYENCGGEFQSPINIDKRSIKKVAYPSFTWDFYEERPKNVTVVNNGHTVVVRPVYSRDERPVISRGPLHKPYCLDHIHFHWGATDDVGSEHTVNGHVFPMEMHAVHSLKDVEFSEAAKTPSGLAVVGYLFKIEKEGHPKALQTIAEILHEVKNNLNRAYKIDSFHMRDLLPYFDTNYIYYKGSLTTPPCTENVHWIISPITIRITQEQLISFRNLFVDDERMMNNFRSVQPLNGRPVTLAI